ncbi:hypothetical protein DY000_02046063 [Brassica cretica]|uniref:Uncharacterized protein n=1 Tax=Brassica cretica TaxID=69181 RepID=A0ABQ7F9U3_BRACR|nr:hypothetical protein DY000_02046063 [Brassica cretica]
MSMAESSAKSVTSYLRTACHSRRVIIQQCDTRLPLTKDDGPLTISRNIKAHRPNYTHPNPIKNLEKSSSTKSVQLSHNCLSHLKMGRVRGERQGNRSVRYGMLPEVYGPGHSTPNKYNLILIHVKHARDSAWTPPVDDLSTLPGYSSTGRLKLAAPPHNPAYSSPSLYPSPNKNNHS